MQLLDNGLGVQATSWRVDQEQAAGYSRIYYIISGEVFYRDAQKECRLRQGWLYVFPSQRPYLITHNPEAPIECLWFHIDLFPNDVYKLLEFDLSASENATLKSTVGALHAEGRDFRHNDRLYITLTEAMSLIISKHPDVRRADGRTAEILNYIRENLFSSSLNVDTVSSRFGYSTSHFIRLFGSAMKTTPHRYITLLK